MTIEQIVKQDKVKVFIPWGKDEEVEINLSDYHIEIFKATSDRLLCGAKFEGIIKPKKPVDNRVSEMFSGLDPDNEIKLAFYIKG